MIFKNQSSLRVVNVKKRIGCLHAHYSNIAYIEQALSAYEVELIHFVDPALILRRSSDANFSLEQAQVKVREQLEWIASSNVDGILLTCTEYISLLQENELTRSIPIIKIDEPFFTYICSQKHPQIIVFTNPATVEGTMKRLYSFAHAHGKSPVIEVRVIENSFDLIMEGKKEEYLSLVAQFMREIIISESNRFKLVSAAQLSMVDAVRSLNDESHNKLGNPLEPLIAYMEEILELQNKSAHNELSDIASEKSV